MSIIIKGLDMPSNGAERCIVIRSDGTVKTFVGAAIPATAEQLPPHGCLKDADVLYAIMEKERDRIAKDYGDDDPFAQCLTKYAMSMVLSAPTIIEAEDSEEKDND